MNLPSAEISLLLHHPESVHSHTAVYPGPDLQRMNKNNIINVDRKVILSMKQSQEYAERVDYILQNANEVTSGFIEDCIQHAKELSDDETTCTVGKIETKLIDNGGKPALVTSVHFEYTSIV
jgi:hypothetical protein